MKVLKGIKVLELTQGVSGPFCTMVLGDMGAEIIKIEQPGKGDDSRSFGPFVHNESAYFMSVNRNKKSLALDLSKKEGIQIFQQLVKEADIFVENYIPGTMQRLGIGYSHVKAINERIIYCSISGYGQDGPLSEKPAYDAVIQAMSGIMSITGQSDGQPTRVGAPVGDMTAALYGAIAIMGALYKRETTGVGDRLDIAILDSQVSVLENAIVRYDVLGEVPELIGNRHASIVPFETFMTRNNHIMVAIGNNRMWVDFCKLVKREDMINDYRFSTNKKRLEYYHELKPILNKVFIEHTTEEWQRKLDDVKIPNSPINSIDKLFGNEQIKARKMLMDITHDKGGRITAPSSPIRFSSDDGPQNVSAPLLGQHTKELLREKLFMEEKEIDNLIKEGIIQ
jgi:CoA:oxalate CoA-transferase